MSQKLTNGRHHTLLLLMFIWFCSAASLFLFHATHANPHICSLVPSRPVFIACFPLYAFLIMSVPQQEVMALTAASQARQQAHQAVQEQLEIQAVAAKLTGVPTLPHEVRESLRSYGQPVRLFGENLANVRDRLRLLLATLQVRGIVKAEDGTLVQVGRAATDEVAPTYDEEEEEVTKYTRAEPELLEARQQIAEFSLQQAAIRLGREAKWRDGAQRVKKRQKATAQEGDVAEKENDNAPSLALR